MPWGFAARVTADLGVPDRRGLPGGLAPDLGGDIAAGYRWTAEGLRERPFEYLEQAGPGAAASSTASDMARFMTMLLAHGELDGARVFGARADRLLTAPLATPIAGAPPSLGGFSQARLPGGFVGVGQGGSTLSFHSALVLVPRLRLGVFIAANSETAGDLTRGLAGGLVDHFYVAGGARPTGGDYDLWADRDMFKGDYRSNRRAYHGLEGFVERLTTLARVEVTDDWRLAIRQGRKLYRLTAEGEPAAGRFLDEDGAGEAVFRVVDGQAPRFVPPGGQETFERVSWWDETATLATASIAVVLCSLLCLLGVVTRNRREFRESSSQSRAGFLQATQAILWLTALGLFAAWSRSSGDPAALMYDWPALPLVIASSCALVAAAMTVVSLLLLPLVWRGGRRLDSWSAARKLQYTLTALLFLFYGGLLGYWGALEPWSA